MPAACFPTRRGWPRCATCNCCTTTAHAISRAAREGGQHEWDQLDGDTEAITVPLALGTFAHGFTFAGEMGYDYTGHPPGGLSGYPREGLWGGEEYDALALGGGLPCAVGIALRRNWARFTPAPEDTLTPPWFRSGEGMQWGLLARIGRVWTTGAAS